MKLCPTCKTAKPLAAFGKYKATKDGLRVYCRECNNAKAREWHHANPEKAAAQAKKYVLEHPEQIRVYLRQYRVENKSHLQEYDQLRYAGRRDAMMERVKRWAQTNPEKARANKARYKKRYPARINAEGAARRSMRLKATPPWLTAIQRAQIAEFYEIATARSVQTGIEHHVDHIHPLCGENFRGLHVPWNLQVITGTENSRKKNHLIVGEP